MSDAHPSGEPAPLSNERCPDCTRIVHPGWSFCPSCGSSLEDDPREDVVECEHCGDGVLRDDAHREVNKSELLDVEVPGEDEDRFFCSLDCVAAEMDGGRDD